jgi:cytochrome P450
MNLFTDEIRRDPYPVFAQLRSVSPVLHVPPPFDFWLVLDYESVKRVLTDHEVFSSAVPAPPNFFIFTDPPRHTRLRGLISRAFTPTVVANLQPRIAELSRELLDQAAPRGEMDLVADYSAPLPMMVIAEMIGIPSADWARFRRWSDGILKLSYTMPGMESETTAAAMAEFHAVTAEMRDYVGRMIDVRRAEPADDLLTKLVHAQVEGERLGSEDILGFCQLLVVAGQETTTGLINNAILCLIENPDSQRRLRAAPEMLPLAIEEVLRYRSPLQWTMRTPTRPVELHGQMIPARKLVLPMIGSANRDPRQFADPDRFDITRDPNPHLAFGHGIHACLGAPLSRVEARIALTDLLRRLDDIELAGNEPWPPRQALNALGPASLPVRFSTVR